MKELLFNQMLLIAAKDPFNGKDLPRSYPLGMMESIELSNESIAFSSTFIIVFNCLTTAEIPLLLDKDIEELKKSAEENQGMKEKYEDFAELFSGIKEKICNPDLHKEISEPILISLRQSIFPDITKESLMFITGETYSLGISDELMLLAML